MTAVHSNQFVLLRLKSNQFFDCVSTQTELSVWQSKLKIELAFAKVRECQRLRARLAKDGLKDDLCGGSGLEAGRPSDGLGPHNRGKDEVATAVRSSLHN